MLFKDISYLEFWQPFCSVQRNHLCKYSRGYYEGQFCENFEFRLVIKEEIPFKDVSYLELWQFFSAILVSSILHIGKVLATGLDRCEADWQMKCPLDLQVMVKHK